MPNKNVALVTGADHGTGRGIALALATAGWSVAVNYARNVQAATATVEAIWSKGGGAIPVQANTSKAADRDTLVERVLNEYGRIDLLVNNADTTPRQPDDLLHLSEEAFDAVLTAHLKAPFFVAQRVARVMIEQVEQGRLSSPKIINIGSISAYTSSPARGAYCMSKAGVGMMTQLFADRLAAHGIHVYEVRPGILDSEVSGSARERYAALVADGLTPVARLGQPGDVGKAVVAIAAGAFPFSTGEVFNVDGGFHIQRL